MFEYSPGVEGALKYSGAHRVVHLAFGLEGVTTTAMQDTVLRRSLEWLADEWPDTEQPTVGLSYPVGGEELTSGEECTITWTATDNVGVVSVDVLRSHDGGATFPDTIAVGESNDGALTWVVPEGASTHVARPRHRQGRRRARVVRRLRRRLLGGVGLAASRTASRACSRSRRTSRTRSTQ